MKYKVIIPQVETDDIPRGAAVIEAARDQARVYHNPRLSFAECCSRAITHRGALIDLTFPVETVGYFDEAGREVAGKGLRKLQKWIGRRELNDNRREQAEQTRADARRLARQGRYAEALIKDRQMGF